jgi:hypothetical protein
LAGTCFAENRKKIPSGEIRSQLHPAETTENLPISVWKIQGGCIFLQENKRIRPHQNLAARLIGYDKDENGNVVGIKAYEDQLNGVEGVRLMQRLNGDIWMPVNDRNEIEPRDGAMRSRPLMWIFRMSLKSTGGTTESPDARHGTAI